MIDLQKLTQALGDLDEKAVLGILNEFVASNPSEEDTQAVVSACQNAMGIVGDLFEKGHYFVGDLIFAGELLTSSLDIIKPFLGQNTTTKMGSIILGTVAGDLHDIGKNIFRGMAEAAGFEVYDLGIDVSASDFVEKVKEIKPNIVGLCGVLTLALDSMGATVKAIQDSGLRDGVKVLIGGTPVTAEACKQIKADAFSTNAAEAVRMCQEWI